jgi:hypothetical protein
MGLISGIRKAELGSFGEFAKKNLRRVPSIRPKYALNPSPDIFS